MFFSIFWVLKMVRVIVEYFWYYVSLLMNTLVQILLFATLLFALAYRLGWWHRFLWHALEQLGRKALNGTPVTIGSFAVDWLRGILVLNNVIVHAPHRPRFGWASPVIVRVGRVRLEFNPINCLFALIVLGEKVPVLDVNLLYVSDIQCFLERSGHVFNVYLLDPLYEMPNNPPSKGGESTNNNKNNNNKRSNNLKTEPQQPTADGLLFMEPEAQLRNSTVRMIGSEKGDTAFFDEDDDNEDPKAAMTAAAAAMEESMMEDATATMDAEAAAKVDQAELVVGEMLKAVHDLGRAVQEGQLPQALQEQRLRIARGLKEFHVNKRAMTQGLSLVGKVGQMVAEKSQQAVAQSNLILQGPKRRTPPPENQQQLVLARFGRVVLEDLRVFTRTTAVVEQEEDDDDDEDDAVQAMMVLEKRTIDSSEATDQSTSDNNNGLTTTTAQHEEEEGVEVTPKSHQRREFVKLGEGMRSNSLPQLYPTEQHDDNDSNIPTSTDVGQRNHRTSFTSTTQLQPAAISQKQSTLLATKNNEQAKKKKKKKVQKKRSFWNKPIKLERVAVRASEFGAPLSAKDEQGFPVLFQPIEKSTDAILKRVVGDIAKCNTGRLVRTAMGEVLDFYMEREYNDAYFNNNAAASAAPPPSSNNNTTNNNNHSNHNQNATPANVGKGYKNGTAGAGGSKKSTNEETSTTTTATWRRK